MEGLGLIDNQDDYCRLPSREALRTEMSERLHHGKRVKAKREEQGRIDYPRRIWMTAADPEGTPVAQYLRLEKRVWQPEIRLPASIRLLDGRASLWGWPRTAPRSPAGGARMMSSRRAFSGAGVRQQRQPELVMLHVAGGLPRMLQRAAGSGRAGHQYLGQRRSSLPAGQALQGYGNVILRRNWDSASRIAVLYTTSRPEASDIPV